MEVINHPETVQLNTAQIAELETWMRIQLETLSRQFNCKIDELKAGLIPTPGETSAAKQTPVEYWSDKSNRGTNPCQGCIDLQNGTGGENQQGHACLGYY